MINKDTIIKLARDSGFNLEQGFLLRVTGIDEDLERLFQAAYRRGLEDAAKVCDNPDCLMNSTFEGAAADIRALKEPT